MGPPTGPADGDRWRRPGPRRPPAAEARPGRTTEKDEGRSGPRCRRNRGGPPGARHATWSQPRARPRRPLGTSRRPDGSPRASAGAARHDPSTDDPRRRRRPAKYHAGPPPPGPAPAGGTALGDRTLLDPSTSSLGPGVPLSAPTLLPFLGPAWSRTPPTSVPGLRAPIPASTRQPRPLFPHDSSLVSPLSSPSFPRFPSFFHCDWVIETRGSQGMRNARKTKDFSSYRKPSRNLRVEPKGTLT